MVFNNCLFVGLNTISAISNVDGLMFIDTRFPLRKQETIKPQASQNVITTVYRNKIRFYEETIISGQQAHFLGQDLYYLL